MRTDRRGQAAVEFALGALLLAFILSFLLGLGPVLSTALDLGSDARSDAGLAALSATGGPGYGGGAAEPCLRALLEDAETSLPPDTAIPTHAVELIPGSASRPFSFYMAMPGMDTIRGKGRLGERLVLPPMGGLR